MTTIFYPRIGSICFYNVNGIVCSGLTGSIAWEKFWRIIRSGRLPRISLRKEVIIKIKQQWM